MRIGMRSKTEPAEQPSSRASDQTLFTIHKFLIYIDIILNMCSVKGCHSFIITFKHFMYTHTHTHTNSLSLAPLAALYADVSCMCFHRMHTFFHSSRFQSKHNIWIWDAKCVCVCERDALQISIYIVYYRSWKCIFTQHIHRHRQLLLLQLCVVVDFCHANDV